MGKLFDSIPRLSNGRLILRKLEDSDADALLELTENETVYRYLPTFLYEKQYDDMHEMIRALYEECFVAKESLILGVFDRTTGSFYGLAEFYGLREDMHKISVGYRLVERCWGQGIASSVVSLMVSYLYSQTDIDLITASTMVENKASARVLQKNDFIMTARGVEEDWGYDSPTIADKWFC